MYEKCVDCNSRPEIYFMNFIVCLVYFIAWAPWCALQFYEALQVAAPSDTDVNPPLLATTAPPELHFFLTWLAVGNSLWKFIIYVILDHDFRIGLKILYARLSCTGWNSAS